MNILNSLLSGIWLVFSSIAWFIPFFILLLILKSPKVKGFFGEKMVQTRAALKLNPNIYRPFHNLILPFNRETTQIDHVFVSIYGIFVVETKNYQGWIFGSEQQAKWTQVIYQKKSYFQNPLQQNYKHIKTLSEMLRLPENVFHSVIVFTHHNHEFKTQMPNNVCDLTQFDDYICQFRRPILSEQDIQVVCKILANPEFITNRQRNKQHIQSLKKR
ncbi:nuclease-related domain-containing protein [Neisseriaceae bacterium B1]